MPVITTKKKCCKDKPRCKTCPVVLERLVKGGYAERLSRGGGTRATYDLDESTPKKVRKAARGR